MPQTDRMEDSQPPVISADEWRSIQQRHVAEVVRVFVWLAPVVYYSVALVSYIFLEGPGARIAIHHVIVGSLWLAAALWTYRRPFPNEWAMPLCTLGALLLAEAMFWVGLQRPQAHVYAMVFALIVGTGFVFLDWRYLLFTILGTIGAVCLLVALSPDRQFDASLGVMSAVCTAYTFGIYKARVRSVWDLESMRLREQWQTEQLRIAKAAAEAANRAKTQFLANMSHELRTPLNSILGFAELLGHEGEMSDRQRRLLEPIGRSGTHLLALINDVIDLAKVESQKLTIDETEFDLRGLLEDLRAIYVVDAGRRGLQLRCEIDDSLPRFVRGDPLKLRQTLINLLGNAIRYTEEGSVALCACRVAAGPAGKSDANRVRFSVEDTGPGIPEDKQRRIFEMFARGDQQHRAPNGAGIGLAISRGLVELMGGDLRLDSTVREGSVFSFEIDLPVVAQPAAEDGRFARGLARLAPETAEPPRVLVCDDDPDNRRFLSELLEPAGVVVRTADGGHNAVALASELAPDLILMDLRMPDTDGYAALQLLQENHQAVLPPVVAMTASTFEEDRDRVLNAGFVDLIHKPIRAETIFELVERHTDARFVAADDSQSSRQRQWQEDELVSALAGVPAPLIDALEAATIRCDMEDIHGLVVELGRHDSGLADELTRIADAFQYDRLQTLAKATRTSAAVNQ